MKKIGIISVVISLLFFVLACNNEQNKFDASGSFEAEETVISSEAAGIIKQFIVEEGQILKAGDNIGYIDSVQVYLSKKQLEAQINAVLGKKPDISVQLATLQEQLKTVEKEKIRIVNLVKADAVPAKQLDDINGNIDVLKKQIAAQKSALEISSEGINKEVNPLYIQIEQLKERLNNCKIINPVNGTVLTKFAQQYEMTQPGKPLYKIADLSSIILRVYVSGNMLPQIKLNQKVKVFTDSGNNDFKETEGIITWINDKAEFTPKTIQTKDERANMVYAIKVKVVNDGSYKIGMYGEIKFQ